MQRLFFGKDIPEIGELDKLKTFLVPKNTEFACVQVVNYFREGILTWLIGDVCDKQ
ncbi:hypothetical protein ACQFX9_05285 [Aliinostoc sp. HNIBRCY26]|uniref:hypothetical protein n=1 Tax=Aliinostoc sp. HNIBRCY26 TaxID=3418997 RepID=UPI003CFEA449